MGTLKFGESLIFTFVLVDRASPKGGRQLDDVVDGDRGRPGQWRPLPGVSLIKLFTAVIDENSQ
jgi:hypothetical protein